MANTSTCIQNLATRFSCSGDMIAGVRIENGSCDADHGPLRGSLPSICYDII